VRESSTKRRPRFGHKAPSKEGNLLRHVKEYLGWESIWAMRVHCGKARHGGRFAPGFTLPANVFPDENPAAALAGAHKGIVRTAEQWIDLAPTGTPDMLLMIPAGRPVHDIWSGETAATTYARIAWIETKSSSGRLSREQREFQDLCRKQNALWWLVSSPEDLRLYIPPKAHLL